MGIFRRISDILTANVNDLLDRSENPEKMIKQMIREMEDAVEASKMSTAQALAGKKRLEKELETNKRLRDEWAEKAAQAIEAGKEDLARRALTRKREYNDLAVSLQSQFDSAGESCENLVVSLRGLEAKLADAKRQQAVLVARRNAAEAQIAAESRLDHAASRSKAGAFANFDRFAEKVEEREAQASALSELNGSERAVEAEFDALSKQDDNVEIELELLKKRLQKDERA